MRHPVRALHRALFDMVKRFIRSRFEIEDDPVASTAYSSGTFEAGGKRFRLILAPVEVEFTIIHRKEGDDV